MLPVGLGSVGAVVLGQGGLGSLVAPQNWDKIPRQPRTPRVRTRWARQPRAPGFVTMSALQPKSPGVMTLSARQPRAPEL